MPAYSLGGYCPLWLQAEGWFLPIRAAACDRRLVRTRAADGMSRCATVCGSMLSARVKGR